jgi:uncharacterized protein YcfL
MKQWVLGLSIVLILTGCSSPRPVGFTVDGEFQRVVMEDSRVFDIVSVEDISSTEVDGHTRGVARVKNNTVNDFDIQYRFHWYDALGLEVSRQPSAWKHTMLQGGDEVSLSEVSLSPKGKEFRVQIREYSN